MQGAALASRYPDVPVIIDHMGKPRIILGPDKLEDGTVNPNLSPNEEELKVWREGMKAMAAVPHVYCKISMLGYIVPGWIRSAEREAIVKGLVLEVVEMFGPDRCMVASNWWANAAASDSDFLSDEAPSSVTLLEKLSSWFSDHSEEDRTKIFSGTAKKAYKL